IKSRFYNTSDRPKSSLPLDDVNVAEGCGELDVDVDIEPKRKKRTWKHGISSVMPRWTPLFGSLLEDILLREADQASLGLILHLGHHGMPCDEIATDRAPSTLIITHTNGIHESKVHWCACKGCPSRVSQLVRAGLFPATPENPESAFTIKLLEEFHLHTLTSKKSAYDFFKALYRLTNNAFPDDVPERYREFNIAVRIWRHLTMVKRSGQAHGIDTLVPHRQPGSLVVMCPTCPEPEFNMSPGWKHTPTSMSYIHQIQLGADGNFRLQKKTKRDDPNDRSLAPGRSYFADENTFKLFLAKYQEEEAPETCSGFRAGNMQRATKFKNCDVTGVVAVMCIRHGIFRRGAMVDLQKGERFCHVDFALAAALRGCDQLQDLKFTYDVGCQYTIHLKKRWMERFPEQYESMRQLNVLLLIKYALNFMKGAGLSHGETVEHPWAENNQAGPMTREMNPGTRHDTLDDLHGFWNWQKVQGISKFLFRKSNEALKARALTADLFEALSQAAGEKLVVSWEGMDTEPRMINGKLESVYRLTELVVPSVGAVFQQLRKIEITAPLDIAPVPGTLPSGSALFLKQGLELEARIFYLKKAAAHVASSGELASPSDVRDLAAKRRSLRGDLEVWRKRQALLLPELVKSVSEELIDEDDEEYGLPETEILLLPSDTPARDRSPLLWLMAKDEIKLREGRAYDLLGRVRIGIMHKSAFVQFKRAEARGQGANTRAQAVVDKASANVKDIARLYNINQQRMLDLGMNRNSPLQYINIEKDLWMKDIRPATTLVQRVKWFRARADKERSEEEVNILHEEFQRTMRSFSRMSEHWKTLGQDTKHSAGKRAYALGRSWMYCCMKDEAKNLFASLDWSV
ncbi:hypothetical protein BD410DRAFT_803124, partial [Rickenella mellea]